MYYLRLGTSFGPTTSQSSTHDTTISARTNETSNATTTATNGTNGALSTSTITHCKFCGRRTTSKFWDRSTSSSSTLPPKLVAFLVRLTHFSPIFPIYIPLKTPENLMFSFWCFQGYKMGALTRTRLAS